MTTPKPQYGHTHPALADILDSRQWQGSSLDAKYGEQRLVHAVRPHLPAVVGGAGVHPAWLRQRYPLQYGPRLSFCILQRIIRREPRLTGRKLVQSVHGTFHGRIPDMHSLMHTPVWPATIGFNFQSRGMLFWRYFIGPMQ